METALYLPVKRFLEKLGFTVKGEVGGCDLVALSGDDPPIVVIGELKLSFNLELILQAVDRAGAADEVWLAAKLSARGKGRESDAKLGRDHHPFAFSVWMAGGGFKGGLTYGKTDDIGWSVVENPVHINDLHATILNQFGFDHRRLAVPYKGLSVRLTDQGGKVVNDLIA